MSGTLPGRDQVGGDVPGWLTSFIGRQDELAQLRQLPRRRVTVGDP